MEEEKVLVEEDRVVKEKVQVVRLVEEKGVVKTPLFFFVKEKMNKTLKTLVLGIVGISLANGCMSDKKYYKLQKENPINYTQFLMQPYKMEVKK